MTSNRIPLPEDADWCPQVGEVYEYEGFTAACVEMTHISSEHSRDRVWAKFKINVNGREGTVDYVASPVGNGRAWRAVVIKGITILR